VQERRVHFSCTSQQNPTSGRSPPKA